MSADLNPNVGRPLTRADWRLHWDVIGFCWQEDAPLRERQAAAQFQRERFRCGGCGGYATRRVPDIDQETGEPERDEDGELYCSVPLCETCTLDDAAPREVGWSDEHVAARVLPLSDWGEPFSRPRNVPPATPPLGPRPVFFSFTIQREQWLRGQDDGEWLLEDSDGRLCAVAYYLRASDAERPETSFRVDTPKRLRAAYDFCTGLHHLSELNERADITDAERELALRDAFLALGVVVTFAGDQ